MSDERLRITGPATDSNSVPAEVLVRAVQGVQQSIWLLAAAADSRALRHRFKPDQSFRQRFTLRVAVPQAGSYALPLALVDERPQAPLAMGHEADMFGSLAGVWKAIAEDDLSAVRAVVRDEGYVLRLLQELQRILPKRGDRWAVSFGSAERAEVELGARHRPILERWVASPPEQRETSVIGELLRIDFAAKRVWILYPPTQREIECSYRDEVEDSIVEARRGLFQVTGQFVLDAEGHPKQLTDVRSVEPVDLSPVQIHEVEVPGGVLVLDPPIVLAPALDPEAQQFFYADVDDLRLILAGRTRDELLQDLADQLDFAWREYAAASELDMTEDARQLRTALLNRMKRLGKDGNA